jgi:hypothetical protein
MVRRRLLLGVERIAIWHVRQTSCSMRRLHRGQDVRVVVERTAASLALQRLLLRWCVVHRQATPS